MKKLISILLITFLCCVMLVGCGGDSEEIKNLKEENADLKEKLESLEEDGTSDSDKEVSDNKERDDIPEIKLNEPFNVETEKGNYKVTFLEARLTDWWQRGNEGDTSKSEIALVYEVENIDFKSGEPDYSGRDGVLLDASAFKVSDENGYLLNMDNATYSDYGYPETVEPGYKAKEELPYIVDGSTSYIDVVLYRATGNLGRIRINVTQ